MFLIKKRKDTFFILLFWFSLPLILLILLPLGKMVTRPSINDLAQTIKDPQVISALSRSIYTSLAAALISFVFGTPLAYILARKNFKGKKVIEGIIDIPIMIPHPVIGIAILGLAARNTIIGHFLQTMGIQIMGTHTGIITVLTFVGLPFYINTAKAGFEAVSPRLEHVSRSLGAGPWSTFWRITLPLAWRNMVLGMIMCLARAISEFGAVVIVAYHPMTAPVLIYERFTAYGLKYSQPVAVWLILISLILFVLMRLFAREKAS
ncbi:ABC transporter permease [Desulfovulcanus sp.]